MPANPEINPFPFLTEDYKREYGVHRWNLKDGTKFLALSAHGWTGFVDLVKQIEPSDQLAASPELITATELPTYNVYESRTLIEKRIDAIRLLSSDCPNTTILLGTPVFDGREKPTNSILYIKAGEITGLTSKRSGVAAWEKANFRFIPEEPLSLVPGTNLGVLICSDLALASLYLRPEANRYLDQVLALSDHKNLIGKTPTFLHPEAKSIIISSCWGIGGMAGLNGVMTPDRYYELQLRNTTAFLLRDAPQIEQIVVVDRAPDIDPASDPTVATKPLNALLGRKF